MKIYTKTGDVGETSLFTGQRVLKSHERIMAYGMVDELNSWIGLIAASSTEKDMVDIFMHIQQELFVIGADLATPEINITAGSVKNVLRLAPESTAQIEAWIDQFEKELPPLNHFILPGGTSLAGQIHITRCVCRRTERAVVFLMTIESINPEIVKYLNRLSDLLFELARVVNHRLHVTESIWKSSPKKPSK